MNTIELYWTFYAQPFLLHWLLSAVVLIIFGEILNYIFSNNKYLYIQHTFWRWTAFSIALYPFARLVTPLNWNFQLLSHYNIYAMRAFSNISIILFAVFSFGFFISISHYLICHREVLFILLNHKKTTNDWVYQLLNQERKKIGINTTIDLYYSSIFQSPSVIWFFGYRLFLPPRLKENYTRQDIKAILLHEISHINNGDIFIHHILLGLQFLFWYLPPIYWLHSRINLLSEKVSDLAASKAFKEQSHYADLIFRFSKESFMQKDILTATGFARKDSQVMTRFHFILSDVNSHMLQNTLKFTNVFRTSFLILTLFLSSLHLSSSQNENYVNLVEENSLEIEYATLPLIDKIHADITIQPTSFLTSSSKNTFWILDDSKQNPEYTPNIAPILNGYIYDSDENELEKCGALELPFIVDEDQYGLMDQYPSYEIQNGANNNLDNNLLVIQATDSRYLSKSNDSNIIPQGGIYIIDVSNPDIPILAAHIPAFWGAGAVVFKNGLLVATLKIPVRDEYLDLQYFQNVIVGFDISNPHSPVELWRGEIPNNDVIHSLDFNVIDPNIVYAGGDGIYIFQISGKKANLVSITRCYNDAFAVKYIKAYPSCIFFASQAISNPFEPKQSVKQWIAILDSPTTFESLSSLHITNNVAKNYSQPSKIIRMVEKDGYFFMITNSNIFISKITESNQIEPLTNYCSNSIKIAESLEGNLLIGNDSLQIYPYQNLLQQSNSLVLNWQIR